VRSSPRLTFFCELEAAALTELFEDPALLPELVALGCGISLGILDCSPERASVVRQLNRAGIPVIGWLLLARDQGYWLNLGNASQALARYDEFRAWTARHRLCWAGVGLDIEPDIREVECLLLRRWRLLPALLSHAFDTGRLREGQRAYEALVAQVHADGYRVESYQFPFIVDERRAGSTLLQRVGGLVDVPADCEVLMVYTSFLRPNGPGILWSYAPDAQAIGVGSTGGGVRVGKLAESLPLNWSELSRDLRLARYWCDSIYIFSLEGCIRQDILPRLRAMDWSDPAGIPVRAARRVQRVRGGLRVSLWAGTHAAPILVGTLGLLWLLRRLALGLPPLTPAGRSCWHRCR